MFINSVIRKCLIPAAVVVTKTKSQSKEETDKQEKVCRPSELPIYVHELPTETKIQNEEEQVPSVIENSIRAVRETWITYAKEFESYEKVAIDSLKENKENVDWLVDYLRKEDNTLPKAGAVGIGALTGLIFGLRGGLIKKTIYATTGALGMAAVCYPKEASEYTAIGVTESKKYLTIAYNFIYGVKKDDPPLELPTLPTPSKSFSEAWQSVKNSLPLLSDIDSTKQSAESTKEAAAEVSTEIEQLLNSLEENTSLQSQPLLPSTTDNSNENESSKQCSKSDSDSGAKK